MLTRRENLEMWLLLEQAMCVLEDLQAGNTSPKEESVSEAIASIRNFGDESDQRLQQPLERIGSQLTNQFPNEVNPTG